MRVISGKYRGKRLLSPSDDRVRPTTDRIKETVFNVLQFRVEGATVLDLFSGSGALGIECLSRGAKEVVFVDKSTDSVALTKANLKGIDGNYRVVCSDFLGALNSLNEKFDIIFLDPPYDTNLGEIAIDVIVKRDMLTDDGVIYFEHSKTKNYVPPAGYKTRTKPMGYTVSEFISHKTVALMTGSFDPITKGHIALLEYGLSRYDEVVVACLVNPDKEYLFSPEERVNIIKSATEGMVNVKTLYSEKTAVEVAKEVGATVFLRGIRDENDARYEDEMREYNLAHGGIDTDIAVLDGYKAISSTRAKEEILKSDFRSLPSGAIMVVQEILKQKNV